MKCAKKTVLENVFNWEHILQRELFYLFQLAYFFWTIHQLRALNYKILFVSRHQNRLDKLLEAPGKHVTRRRIGLLVGHIPSQFVWSQSTFVAPWENNFETVRSSQTHLVKGWTISSSDQPHHSSGNIYKTYTNTAYKGLFLSVICLNTAPRIYLPLVLIRKWNLCCGTV